MPRLQRTKGVRMHKRRAEGHLKGHAMWRPVILRDNLGMAPQWRIRGPGVAPPAWRKDGGMAAEDRAGTARVWEDTTQSSSLHMEMLLGHRVDCHKFTSEARRLAKGGACFHRSSFS